MDKAAGVGDARNKIDHFPWYLPHNTASISQRGLLPKQNLCKKPTELGHIERFVLMKEVNIQIPRNSELRSQESMTVPKSNIIGFQLKKDRTQKKLNIDTFCRLPLLVLNVILGSKNTLMLTYC